MKKTKNQEEILSIHFNNDKCKQASTEEQKVLFLESIFNPFSPNNPVRPPEWSCNITSSVTVGLLTPAAAGHWK